MGNLAGQSVYYRIEPAEGSALTEERAIVHSVARSRDVLSRNQPGGLHAPSGGTHKDWRRLDGVDLLRGLSILLVVILHTNIRIRFAHTPMGQLLPVWLGAAIAWNGDNGVTVFFAVSGFLITSTSMRRWGRLGAIRLRAFYGLRFARIAPLLLLLLAVLSVLDVAHADDYVIKPAQASLGRAVFAVLTFHFNWLEGRVGYLPGNWDVLWSLSVEEAFYLFFPIAAVLLRRSRAALIALLLAFVAMGPFARTLWTAGRPVWQEKSYLGGMDAIALGCLAALALPWLLRHRRLVRAAGAAGVMLLALVLGSHWATWKLGLYRTGLDGTVLALGSCGVIVWAAATGWRAAAVLRPRAGGGRNSYEVYLTHMFVVTAIASWWNAHHRPFSWTTLLLYAFAIAGAALLGAVVARGFSEPANRWLRKRWHEGPQEMGAAADG